MLGSIATIVGSIATLAYWLGKKFAEIDEKLEEHDKRFEAIERKLLEHDKRFESIERKLLEHDKRFEAIEKKFVEHDKRFEEIDKRFDAMDRKFGEVLGRLESIEKTLAEHGAELQRVTHAVERLVEAVKSSQEFVIDFLSYEGVPRKEASEVLKNEVSRILGLAHVFNPLTREEYEKLKELLQKDELTLEEARELYRIANKLVYEYGTSECWKLLWYSRFWIGYNLRKMKERREEGVFREVRDTVP